MALFFLKQGPPFQTHSSLFKTAQCNFEDFEKPLRSVLKTSSPGLKYFSSSPASTSRRPWAKELRTTMSRDARKFIHAAECAERVGKYAFGLNDKKAIQILRQLADDLENGTVVLHSLTTSSCATHEEFAVREVVVEILEELPADQANNAGEVVLLPRFARTPGSD